MLFTRVFLAAVPLDLLFPLGLLLLLAPLGLRLLFSLGLLLRLPFELRLFLVREPALPPDAELRVVCELAVRRRSGAQGVARRKKGALRDAKRPNAPAARVCSSEFDYFGDVVCSPRFGHE